MLTARLSVSFIGISIITAGTLAVPIHSRIVSCTAAFPKCWLSGPVLLTSHKDLLFAFAAWIVFLAVLRSPLLHAGAWACIMFCVLSRSASEVEPPARAIE
jgi:hypothetical protein